MTTLHLLALTLVGALPARPRDDRGDVAQEELSSLLRRALRQVQ